MADVRANQSAIVSAKGDIALKRVSLKVGIDLTKVLSGAQAVDAALEGKILTAVQQLGY